MDYEEADLHYEDYQALALSVVISAMKDAVAPVTRPNGKYNRKMALEYLSGDIDDEVPLPIRTALAILGLPESLCYQFRNADIYTYMDFLQRI